MTDEGVKVPRCQGAEGAETPDSTPRHLDTSTPLSLARHWRQAIADPAIAATLESIYAQAAAAIDARKPVCVASGRCCHFEAHGHRLYVTGLEAAYTLSRVPLLAASSPRSSAETRDRTAAPRAASSGTRLPLPILTTQSIAAARAAGTCPYLAGTLCTVHTIKPLSCRTYYCDPTAQDWQHELTERLLGELRALHDRHNIEYRYGEWRDMLSLFATESSK